METGTINFEERLKLHSGEFAKVVPFEPGDKLLLMDFTKTNTELTDEILNDTNLFIQYINKKLKEAGAKYGIGGYGENRAIYRRSEIFGPNGPSPTTMLNVKDGAKAPSRWEGEEDVLSLVEEETIGYRYADPHLYGLLKNHVLQNRSVPTQAEEILWQAIKTKRLNEYKFRQQHIIDRFITDFVCLKKRLVIEVDGLIHQLPENKESDEQRTRVLNELGFNVIRFTNDEVLFQLENVLQKILVALEKSEVELQPIRSEKVQKKEEWLQSEGCEAASPPPGDLGGLGMGRSLHLGIDIWGKPYTKVIAPLNGIVHSFAFNNAFGDYGATIILTHNLDGESFHTLYGHLSLNSIKNIQEGDVVRKGDVIAEFGIPFENGQWPPHLHFQIIKDLQGMKGDYPGVCAVSEKEFYLNNCPDADLIVGMMAKS
jgi:very-short-patch-repair endonuclease